MGRTAEPRSWRARDHTCPCPDGPADESGPVASTSSAPDAEPADGRPDRTRSSQRATRRSWVFNDAPVPTSSTVTEQLRRSVLPASTSELAGSQRASDPPWRASFGRLASAGNDDDMSPLDTSHIRISRSARASWNAAFNDAQGFPDSSTMLSPRLGTPVPTLATSALTVPAPQAIDYSTVTYVDARVTERAREEALTTIGRRALARHRLSMLETDTRGPISNLVQSLNLETLERAQLAVEGSRIALEQARLAIRIALRNSETRLGRLADLIRNQLQTETSEPLPPLPRSTEVAAIEAERSEYNLERSLANLRAASLEIDRVLAASQSSSSRTSSENVGSAESVSSTNSSPATSTGGALFASLALPPLFQTGSPENAARSQHQRPAQPIQTGLSDSILRQPMPRRPIRYLRGSQTPSVASLRSRVVSSESSTSRSSRPQRSSTNRGLAVQVSLVGYANDSTSNLARNVLTNLSQRSPNLGEEITLLSSDDDEVRVPPTRPTGYRQIGRWIRLDANGDEFVEGTDSSREPLGWSWASLSQPTASDEEKAISLATLGAVNGAGNGHGLVASPALGIPFGGDLVGR